MIGAAMLRNNLKSVNKKCPNISSLDKVYWVYFGHHAGGGTLNYVLKNTCNPNQSSIFATKYWTSICEKKKGGTCRIGKKTITPQQMANRFHGSSSDVKKKAAQLGVTGQTQPIDKNKCPLNNTSLRFTEKYPM